MKRSTTKWRGLVILAGVLIVAGLLLGACGSSDEGGGGASPSAAGTPKPGGTYNFVLGSDPYAIDAAQAYESEGMQVVHQVFQGLVAAAVDDKGNVAVAPGIADRWETTDNQTWTFHLKKGVMFSAPVSTEVTAQTFIDSWNYVTDEKNASYVSYVLAPIEGMAASGFSTDPKKGLTGLSAPDPYTLVVKLQYPFADFAVSLLHPVSSALPVDYIKKIGYEAFALKPVGTGPYMVSKWVRKQYIDLVKNPDYWDKANSGYVDKIHMPIIVSNQTSWLEFQKGDVDYTHVPPGQVAASKANPNVTSGEWTAKGWPYITTDYVAFNWEDKVVGGSQGLELRKAMYMSTDAEAILNIVHEGEAVPATGVVPQGMPGWRPDVSPYKTNDDAGAKAALAAYGKTPPTLNYWYNTDENNQKTAEVLQAGWKNAGVTVTLSNFEWTTFLDKTSKGEGQVYRSGWVADYPSYDNFLYPLFQSDQPTGNRSSLYSNPEFDALLAKARATNDATARYDIYAEAEKMMLTDAAVVPTVYPRAFRVTNNRIAGFFQDPIGFVNMWQLWVK
ncbi:MAG: peptide ABC transporter substrate-binding protein [Actinobacteria bacterium]|nr:peptide ABC transporter substrate-binding protein [Actinomycetota bacterium]